MKSVLCEACQDTGIPQHVQDYWRAYNASAEGCGRDPGPEPEDEACDECPLCEECGRAVADHTDLEIETAKPQGGTGRYWDVPLCQPMPAASIYEISWAMTRAESQSPISSATVLRLINEIVRLRRRVGELERARP